MNTLLVVFFSLEHSFLKHSFTVYISSSYPQLSTMARKITVAAAQVGAVHKDSKRSETLSRLISLLEQASEKEMGVLVYP